MIETSLDKVVRLARALDDAIALHGTLGAPGYELLHSPHPTVRIKANKLYLDARRAGVPALKAQASLIRGPWNLADQKKRAAGGKDVTLAEHLASQGTGKKPVKLKPAAAPKAQAVLPPEPPPVSAPSPKPSVPKHSGKPDAVGAIGVLATGGTNSEARKRLRADNPGMGTAQSAIIVGALRKKQNSATSQHSDYDPGQWSVVSPQSHEPTPVSVQKVVKVSPVGKPSTVSWRGENHDGSANKFYESKVEAHADGTATHTTRYGSTLAGKPPTVKATEHATVESALKSHSSKVKAKSQTYTATHEQAPVVAEAVSQAVQEADKAPEPIKPLPVPTPIVTGKLPPAANAEAKALGGPPPVASKVKNFRPMKYEETDVNKVSDFYDDPKWFFQQKIDGMRGALVIEPGKAPWVKASHGRKLESSTAVKTTDPMLAALIKTGVGTPTSGPTYIVDGEVLDGKFYVFDLVIPGQENKPWGERMAMAETWVAAANAAGVMQVVAVPTARTREEKIRLHKATEAGGQEGMVVKRAAGKYTPSNDSGSKRTLDVLKAKYVRTADVVVMSKGVGTSTNGSGATKENVAFGVWDEKKGELIPIGTASMLGKEAKLGKIEVGDVIEVSYLFAENNNLTQPRVVGIRKDKKKEETGTAQFRVRDKAVLDKKVLEPSATKDKPPQVIEPVVPAPQAVPEPFAGPPTTKGWTRIGPQAGSNKGGLFTDTNGEKYYVKASKSDLHAQNEVLASQLYSASGLTVPEVQLVQLDPSTLGHAQLGIASKIMPGKANLGQAYKTEKGRADLADGFAVHAWLSNWDTAGLGKDNMVTGENGHLSVVDMGGSLLFRAQGAPKGSQFGPTVGEVGSLRNPAVNSDASDVFNHVTEADIAASVANHVAPVTPEQIDALVYGTITDPTVANQVAETLKARRLDLMKRYPPVKA